MKGKFAASIFLAGRMLARFAHGSDEGWDPASVAIGSRYRSDMSVSTGGAR